MFKSIFVLAFIVCAHFYGLFVVLPVLSVYAQDFNGANGVLTGLIVGSYALAQIIFQFPFGRLSDKIGRKNTLALGLGVFFVGSLICASANNEYIMILGRFIQGVGAVGGVASAFVADLSRANERGRAMAIIGVGMGLSFSAAMISGPILASKFGLSSLFYLCMIICVCCFILLFLFLPSSPKKVRNSQQSPSILELLANKNLAILSLSNLAQKALLNAVFVAMPLILVNKMNYIKADLWQVYALATIFGFFAMGFSGALGDKKGLGKEILLFGTGLFACCFVLFWLGEFYALRFVFVMAAVVFFIAFNMHEPMLQGYVSKVVKPEFRGAGLGLSTACGYVGSFFGSLVSSSALEYLGFSVLAGVLFILCIGWFFLLTKLQKIS